MKKTFFWRSFPNMGFLRLPLHKISRTHKHAKIEKIHEDYIMRTISRCWGDHWDAATGEEMDLNPHIPKPEPPPEPEKEEEKKEEEKKEGEEKKEEQATTEKEEKKEEEKEKADEKKEGDEKKVIRPPF